MDNHNSGLLREIRRWDLVALMINSMLGASIFGLPSRIYALSSSYSLFVFLFCTIIIGLIILCFAEVSSRFTETGGQYLYARKTFGALFAFEIGWLMWIQRLTSFAAVCNILVITMGFFWPAANEGWMRAALISLIVAMLTLINIRGVKKVALVSNVFTIGKLVPILLFVIAGLFFINAKNFSFTTPPGISEFATSALLLLSVFTGFEAVAIPAGEIRDPQKNLPFAMLTALAVLAILYILIQIVCIGVHPNLANSMRPLTETSQYFLGTIGASFISVGAVIASFGTLMVIMLSATRVLFAMSEQEQLPKILSLTHKRFHTPYISILFSAAFMLALTISGTFIYFLTINVIIRLANYAVTCLSLPVLRKKNIEPARFRVPYGNLVSILSAGLCIWLMSGSTFRAISHAGIAALAGLGLYFLFGHKGSKARSDTKKPAHTGTEHTKE